jgi:hypothetical protein
MLGGIEVVAARFGFRAIQTKASVNAWLPGVLFYRAGLSDRETNDLCAFMARKAEAA